MAGTISYNSTTHVISGTGWASRTAYLNYDGSTRWGFTIWERAIGATPWTKLLTVYNPIDNLQEDGTVCPGTFTCSYTAKLNYEYKAQRFESGYDLTGNPYSTEHAEDGSNILQITASQTPATITLSDSTTFSYVDSFVITTTSVAPAQMTFSDSITLVSIDTILVTVSPAPVQIILTDSITNSSVSLSMSLQTPNSIGGKVQLQNGSPVSGASIFAIEQETNRVLAAVTDVNGEYAIAGILEGKIYHVSCVYQDINGNKYTSLTNSYVS